jgi:DNA polymerase-3 subunit delta'
MSRHADDESVAGSVANLHFEPLLPWQRQAWQRLLSRVDRLPHGLLLSGGQGVGKRRFADRFVAWLLCQARQTDHACGHCQSCTWLKAGTHPALLRISREVDAKGKVSKQIKIDQIRALIPFVQQTSADWRVVIIEPAESMNMAAANALLKTLEEPSERVLLLLIADQSLQLPATIRSRVQQIALGRIDPQIAQEFVADEAQVSRTEAQVLLGLAGGAPLAALDLASSNAYQACTDWLVDWLRVIQSPQATPAVSAAWQKRLSLPEWLMMMQWLLRDLLAQQLGLAAILPLRYEPLLAHYRLAALQQLYDQVLADLAAQSQNVQAGLVYDSLLQQLRQLAHV